jgi:hypothetical protein
MAEEKGSIAKDITEVSWLHCHLQNCEPGFGFFDMGAMAYIFFCIWFNIAYW